METQPYMKAFDPNEEEKMLNPEKLKSMIDINDDGSFDLYDIALIAGLMVAGYFAIKLVRGK